MVKNPPANAEDARDAGLTPGLERSPGTGNGNLLQYSCLENSTDRGAWRAAVHGATKSQTCLGTKPPLPVQNLQSILSKGVRFTFQKDYLVAVWKKDLNERHKSNHW